MASAIRRHEGGKSREVRRVRSSNHGKKWRSLLNANWSSPDEGLTFIPVLMALEVIVKPVERGSRHLVAELDGLVELVLREPVT